MIESLKLNSILCGSSARKLRRGKANLLGGRAWGFHLMPLVYPELDSFNLLHILNNGLLPSHYLEEKANLSLKSYVTDYLKQEIFEEGLTRNIPAFSRFFDAMAFDHDQMINFTNIARDCAIDVKTVQQYYQILVDTFLGTFILPYKKIKTVRSLLRPLNFISLMWGSLDPLSNDRFSRKLALILAKP